MQGWHTTFLGMRGLPRDISDFEMKAFFTFDGAERDAINARRGDSHKLGLALHIGFLRMSGRLLGAFRVIPVALWRHLGNELGIAAPEVASLRAMYERGRTLRAPTCLQAALSRSQDQRASAHRGGRMLSSVLPVHHHRPVDPYGAAPDLAARTRATACSLSNRACAGLPL